MYSKKKLKSKDTNHPISEFEQFKTEMREQLNMLWQMGAYLGTRIENIEGNKMLEQSILYWRQDDDTENDD